ncbi:acyltransferase [Klebsiella pneumoniae]|uniref:Acyltransferase n=1 Tax=Klebsiella pneumoniae TaxID=573 RepID=A0A939NSG5_KLEPN|nr:acyltransferase [Klebsiella pneumoniae]
MLIFVYCSSKKGNESENEKEIIDSLTGIRGIAAIYVVIYHLFHHASDNNFINNGYLSVDLFFILSGFIITHAHRNDF